MSSSPEFTSSSTTSNVAVDEPPTWRPTRPPPAAAAAQAQTGIPSSSPSLDGTNYPGGKKSLAGISLRAFLIGTTLGLSASLTLTLRLLSDTPLWRLPFFLASLCIFHFLEYYVTAAHNTRHASVSAFLLSSNGWAYNLAHMSAAVECLAAHFLFQPRTSYFAWSEPVEILGGKVKIQLVLGLLFMAVGQTTRSLAMAQAGSNFNHTVQVERKDGHELVTHGVYALLRHPSYFGFFWWGLGTQLVLGNVVCFVGYLVVLWKFFNSRIQREERFLIAFFGDEYVQYKKQSIVGIPGIW